MSLLISKWAFVYTLAPIMGPLKGFMMVPGITWHDGGLGTLVLDFRTNGANPIIFEEAGGTFLTDNLLMHNLMVVKKIIGKGEGEAWNRDPFHAAPHWEKEVLH